ncbi:lantibiotic ABC transporter permease [Caproiciproducens sp. NJN-50]|uniref:ABC transporter permease n=1 Tax=Acutalibacteraceae TaxID=3082771 RepID=UPI000FFE2FE3|nr:MULTISPECIES: ABC transporter permease [Acutalibacteraceae]QAT50326.1 lantibiotic ABC transporter permease [Caproiciproducens sp. NJN-50]
MPDSCFFIEWRKLKRTHLAFIMLLSGILGGLYAYAFFATQGKKILRLPVDPIDGLLTQTYGMIALLNVLSITVAASLLFYIEYNSFGIKRMMTLPISAQKLFCNKALILLLLFLAALLFEFLGLAVSGILFLPQKWESIGSIATFSCYVFLLSVPSMLFMLFMSALSKNIWVTVGIGVAGLFSGLGYGAAGNGNPAFLIDPFALLFYPATVTKSTPNSAVIALAVADVVILLAIIQNVLKRKEWDQ